MQHPNLITHWTVKRSGATMTISGLDPEGQPATVTLVRSVTISGQPGIAHAKDAGGRVMASLVT